MCVGRSAADERMPENINGSYVYVMSTSDVVGYLDTVREVRAH